MSYNRPDVNRGPSTSGSIHPLPSPASTASYLFPQGSGLPLQSWQSQQSRYEEPYSPRSQAPLEYRIPSRPSLSDYQLPSPATSSRHSISSSSTYRCDQSNVPASTEATMLLTLLPVHTNQTMAHGANTRLDRLIAPCKWIIKPCQFNTLIGKSPHRDLELEENCLLQEIKSAWRFPSNCPFPSILVSLNLRLFESLIPKNGCL